MIDNKLRVICVRTGDKFGEWYENNLKHMIDTYSGLKYDEFCVIRDDEYDGVFNKLMMFDRYRDGQNIYFDLDVVIKGDCNHLLREDFHVCWAWWRETFHTPINSSIMSWKGDQSHIYNLFSEDPEYYMLKYRLGMDQLLHENVKYSKYNKGDGYCSYQTVTTNEENFSVYLFNQRYEFMRQKQHWFQRFQLPL